MASASKTPNLNLPQWVGTEKPERTDFSAAFDAIDTELWKYIYPVGSLFETTESAFNPQTHFGGTWEQYGAGRVTVGYSSGETEFNAGGKTGGDKTHVLTVAELAQHRHGSISSLSLGQALASTAGGAQTGYAGVSPNTGNSANTYGTSNTGSNEAHNNLQPYITVFRWRRTA